MVAQAKKVRSGNLCSRCSALCCKYVAIQIDKPTTRGDFEDIRWYISHHDVWVFVDEGDWYVCIESRCRYLTANNRCRMYADRPRICRRHTTVNCEFHDQANAYQMKFERPEEIREFAEEYFRLRRARVRRLRRR